MKSIQKIKLGNFKRFEAFTVDFDDELNLLIGDNQVALSINTYQYENGMTAKIIASLR